jgi:hypothetical protein
MWSTSWSDRLPEPSQIKIWSRVSWDLELGTIISVPARASNNLAVNLCVCLLYQLLNSRTNLYETWYVYHGTWAYLSGALHKCLPSVCVSVNVSLLSLLGNGKVYTFPRQRTREKIELLDASFSVRYVSYQRRVCGSVCVSLHCCKASAW